MYRLLKFGTLWFTGAFCYGIIEIVLRGYTHISMGIIGGICFISMGAINRRFYGILPIFVQLIFSATLITFLEFVTGYIVNLKMNLNIWDYSHIPFNFLGQICIPFFGIWILISFIGILLERAVRVVLFKEDIIILFFLKSNQKSLKTS